jgi:catechol 1,2-dioxygenase
MKLNKNLILVGLVLLGIIALGLSISQLDKKQTQNPSNRQETAQRQGDCVPTFPDGGGPYYQENSPFRQKIVPEQNSGERLMVSGKVLRSDCKTPVANAVLDIWQADETGEYQDNWYRGKVRTDREGNYSFETVVPKGYGEGTGYRPPHIHFKVFEGDREIITSQMFFPEVQGTPGFDDAYIMRVETNSGVHEGYHDIILP